MYTTTRAEAADILGMSTRSIDRYVKAGKLRSKKEGKIIYIHSQDIQNLSGTSPEGKAQVIMPEEKIKSYSQGNPSSEFHTETPKTVAPQTAQTQATLEKIYLDLRQEIKQKDQALQDLAIRLGQAQEIAKNSVSLIEFKKSQFLLEESKGHLTHELEHLRNKEQELAKELKYEKTTKYILISTCIILLFVLAFISFLKI